MRKKSAGGADEAVAGGEGGVISEKDVKGFFEEFLEKKRKAKEGR